MGDLRDRVPGQSLIEELLRQWDRGTIHLVEGTEELVIGDDAVSWYDGVKGERIVASVLAQLGPEWTVLHSVPAGKGRGDVDHVVFGPGGVFTINTKNSSGRRVWAAGYGLRLNNVPNNGYIQGALREHEHAERVLSAASGFAVPVTTLITFVQPSGLTVTARPGDGVADIRVISDAHLLPTIQGRRVMSDQQLARLWEVAILPETWHTRPQPSLPGSKLAREFDALDEAVGWHIARRGQQPDVGVAARPVRATARIAAASSTRPVQRTAATYRAPQRRRTGRRSRRSTAEVFVRAFAPFAGLLIAWFAFVQITSR
jgi:hypothetical protein